MSHTLKTYPDGSEITTTTLVGAVCAGLIGAALMTAPIWIDEIRAARKRKQNRLNANKIKFLNKFN